MDALVVDDDAASRDHLVRVLQRAGFMVAAVENGLAAFAELQQRRFRVIVCDIQMPFLDGMKFYEQLLEVQPELASQVLFVSGFADRPEVQAFLKRSGQPVVAKPYEIADLVEVVRQLFGQQGAPGPYPAELERHRALARRLPEEFLQMQSTPRQRISQLLSRYWRQPYDVHKWWELAQELLTILDPLTKPGAEVTEELRQRCEEAVLGWIAEQR